MEEVHILNCGILMETERDYIALMRFIPISQNVLVGRTGLESTLLLYDISSSGK